MLVLTRKVGEEIIIGDDIHIMVVAVKGEKARIGVSVPKKWLWTVKKSTRNARTFSEGNPPLPQNRAA